MKRNFLASAMAILFASSSGFASELDDPRISRLAPEVSWSYQGEHGPQHWHQLPGDALCADGLAQSPIAIEPGWNHLFSNVHRDSSLPSLHPHWQRAPLQLVNTGRTVQVLADPSSFVDVDGIRYHLKQFHFHSPSEHILNEKQSPMEIHFVHATDDTAHPGILVIAVMVQSGPANHELGKIWKFAPSHANSSEIVTVPHERVNASAFLPWFSDYIRYDGSLTTPPCTEGVKWLVYTTPITASPRQLSFLQKLMKGPNNRPIQPIDERELKAACFTRR